MTSRVWLVGAVVLGIAGDAKGQPPSQQPPTEPPPQPSPVDRAPAPQPYPDPLPPPAPQPQPYPGPPAPQPSGPQPYPGPPAAQPSGPPLFEGAPPPRPASSKKHGICFAGRPLACGSTLLVEIGGRGGDRNRSVLNANLGLLIHNGFDAYGATFGVTGISGGEVEAKHTTSPWLAVRYRRYLGTWGFATDLSVGYAGGPAAEVALGWADVLAVTAGINRYELELGGRDTVASVGLRIGAPTIGGLFYAAVLVATAR